MLRLAAAVLLTPIFMMIGAPSTPVKMAATTYGIGQPQAAHLRIQERQTGEFSVGTAAYAAQYPMVSAQAMALITSR